jgi:UDP-N-acetylmuramoylalanine--D-glutamate ligase
MDFSNKKVLVCGIARSGVGAANLLSKYGAAVTLSDNKQKDKLKEFLDRVNTDVTVICGRNPVEECLEQDLIVLSPGVPANLEFLNNAREKGIKIIGEFELGYMFCKAPVYAVTGTNGKTTTTALLHTIMRDYNPKAKVVGNIGIAFTEEVEGIEVDGLCIAEVSSFQLETADTFKPHIAAVLNLTPDHLDRHATFENYVDIKARIFMNQDKNDFLILNYDDENCRKLAERATSKVLFFSRSNYSVNGIYLKDNNFYLNVDNKAQCLFSTKELKITGNHSYENAMAAILMAFCAGVDIKSVIQSAKTFEAVEHRIEFVRDVNGVVYYNDSKGTNPESAIKAIEAMDRPIILIGGGYNKGSDFSLWVQAFDKKVKKLLIIGEVSDILEKTCIKYNFHEYERIDTFDAAVKRAGELAEKGDAVLLSPACASWDMFESYEHRGKRFKELVKGM